MHNLLDHFPDQTPIISTLFRYNHQSANIDNIDKDSDFLIQYDKSAQFLLAIKNAINVIFQNILNNMHHKTQQLMRSGMPAKTALLQVIKEQHLPPFKVKTHPPHKVSTSKHPKQPSRYRVFKHRKVMTIKRRKHSASAASFVI